MLWMVMRARTWIALALLVCALPAASVAQTPPEDLRIPMAEAGPDGLEAVLVRPAGSGRHPLAIVTHGSPRDPASRAGMHARGLLPQMLEFARRGFLTVGVMRRGYGTSGGEWAEGFGPCDHADYISAGQAGALDLVAAVDALSRRDDVDRGRILAVGVSAGGFATIALTADPPLGLVAAISFAGGRGSLRPDEVCSPDALVAAFGRFGARSRVPMLWVYAENDHFFGQSLARRFVAAFDGAGARATLVEAPAFGEDGHRLFSRGIPVWTPLIDDFLAGQGFTPPPAPPGGGRPPD